MCVVMGFIKDIFKQWRNGRAPVRPDGRPEVAAGSHIGRVRKLNEDSYAVIRLPVARDAVIAVADGIGGEEAGEVASWFAVRYLLRERFRYGNNAVDTPETARKMMVDGLLGANRALDQVNSKLGGAHFAMGTTVAAAAFVPGAAVIVHAGDSRCYRWRAGEMRQLTSDHTWAQNLVSVGELHHDDVAGHPWEHTLSNCLGILPEVEFDVDTVELQPGDRFLLCTDGVTQMLSAKELGDHFSNAADPCAAVRSLISASLQRGGVDNIAVAAAYVP